ncbi:hypothetical protein D3C71_1709490 [compost metagenome]
MPRGAQQFKAAFIQTTMQHPDAKVFRDFIGLGNARREDVITLLAQPLVSLPLGVVPQV